MYEDDAAIRKGLNALQERRVGYVLFAVDSIWLDPRQAANHGALQEIIDLTELAIRDTARLNVQIGCWLDRAVAVCGRTENPRQ